MDVPKKVTDFIVLDEGSIGRKAAVMTGAALAASVLGMVLQTSTAHACYCAHVDLHDDYYSHCIGCP